MRATRLVVVGKAVISSAVGIVEFCSAAVLDRSPWGTVWQLEPRWVGLLLFMWGGSDLVWQTWLPFRMRRAWWYCTLSSTAAVAVSIATRITNDVPHPNLLLLVGCGGLVSLIFLSVFESAFSVSV